CHRVRGGDARVGAHGGRGGHGRGAAVVRGVVRGRLVAVAVAGRAGDGAGAGGAVRGGGGLPGQRGLQDLHRGGAAVPRGAGGGAHRGVPGSGRLVVPQQPCDDRGGVGRGDRGGVAGDGAG